MSLLQRLRSAFSRLFPIRQKTMFGTAEVYEITWHDNKPLRVLDVEGTYQSATYLDDRWCEVPFPYLALYDKLFEQVPDARDILMLGGGGFAYPKHLIAHHPATRVDVVEIDPAIIGLAKQHFLLDRLEEVFHAQQEGRLTIVQMDALDYLEECRRRGVRYDAILGDCFAAGSFADKLVSLRGAALAQDCLTREGVYLVNIVTALEGTNSAPLKSAVDSLCSAFAHVWAIPCDRYAATEQDNVLVAASNLPPEPVDALRLYDRL